MSDPQELKVSRTVTVAAPPEEIFALLADHRCHHELDGSGTVKQGTSGPDRLSLGAKFGMRMRIGLPYLIRNQVVEFEEGRRIAWRHFGHHVWRWELEPVTGGTRVTETFDYAPARSPKGLQRTGFVDRNTAGIEASLARLTERFGPLPAT